MPEIVGERWIKSFVGTRGPYGTTDGVALKTEELEGARRLQGVDVKWADAVEPRHQDGWIAGEREVSLLWSELTGGGLAAVNPEVHPQYAERIAAVDSFRIAALRAREAKAQGDTFYRSGKLESGPAKGEPLDTAKARPAIQLNEAEKLAACAKARVDPESIGVAFANLCHRGEFYTALIPKDAVRDVYLMLESFPAPVPAAHAMLRFALDDDKPAVLVPQNGLGDGKQYQLSDLVFSSEALGQPGWKYDLVRGQKGHFGLVDRFESLEDRFRHVESYSPKHPVSLHRIALSDEEKQDVLSASVLLSEERGFSATYNTLARSCTTEAFLALDRGVGDDLPLHVKLGRIVTGERIPTASPTYLALRGLVPKGEKPTLLSDEMASAPRPATERVFVD
ncbi:MAG: DUF4105 domain-containing protein [Myxococcota bacterium]